MDVHKWRHDVRCWMIFTIIIHHLTVTPFDKSESENSFKFVVIWIPFTVSQFNYPFLRNLIVHDNKLDISRWLAHFLFDTSAKKCLSLQSIYYLSTFFAIYFENQEISPEFCWYLSKRQSLQTLYRLGCDRQFKRWQLQ